MCGSNGSRKYHVGVVPGNVTFENVRKLRDVAVKDSEFTAATSIIQTILRQLVTMIWLPSCRFLITAPVGKASPKMHVPGYYVKCSWPLGLPNSFLCSGTGG